MATAPELSALGICWTLIGSIVYHKSLGSPWFERQTHLYPMSKRKSYNMIQLPGLIVAIAGLITTVAGLIIAIEPK